MDHHLNYSLLLEQEHYKDSYHHQKLPLVHNNDIVFRNDFVRSTRQQYLVHDELRHMYESAYNQVNTNCKWVVLVDIDAQVDYTIVGHLIANFSEE